MWYVFVSSFMMMMIMMAESLYESIYNNKKDFAWWLCLDAKKKNDHDILNEEW